jgi:hypothetical protein
VLALFDNTGARIAHTYNGLTLNSITAAGASGAGPYGYQLDNAVPLTQLDSISDPHQTRDGMESYDVRKVARIFRVEGIIRARTLAELFDKQKALVAAFDPAKVAHNNPSTYGYLAYDFSVPTEDTANYATGLVPSRYYLRARSLPEPVVSSYTAMTARFGLELVARDPRRYLQSTSSIAAAGSLNNSLADYRSWPTLTLNMSGAGSATAAITNTTSLGAKTLTLNLSGCVNTDVVIVDMESRTITKNGVSTPSLYVSGDWFEIEPATQTIATANFTNVGSWSLVWRRAFCL